MIKKILCLFLFSFQANMLPASATKKHKRPHGKTPEAICGKLSFDLKERGRFFLQLKHAKDKEEETFFQEKIIRNSKEITKNLTERIISAAYNESIENDAKARKELLLFQTKLVQHDLFRKLIEIYALLNHEQRESTVRLFYALKNFPSNKFTTVSGTLKIEEKLLQLFKEKIIPKYQICEILISLLVIGSNLENLKEFLEILLSLSQDANASISFSALKTLDQIFSSPLIKHHFQPPEKSEDPGENYLWFLHFIKKMFSSSKKNVISMTNYIKIFSDFLTIESNRPFLLRYTGDEHEFLRFLEIFEERSLKLKKEAYYMIALFLINPREDRSSEIVCLIKKNEKRIKKALWSYIESIEKAKGDPEEKSKIITEIKETYDKMLENLKRPCKTPKEASSDHPQEPGASH